MPRVSVELVDALSGAALGMVVYPDGIASEQALLAGLRRLLGYTLPPALPPDIYRKELASLQLGRDITVSVPLVVAPQTSVQSSGTSPIELVRLNQIVNAVRRALVEATALSGPTQNPDLYARAIADLDKERRNVQEDRDAEALRLRQALAQAGHYQSDPCEAIRELADALAETRAALKCAGIDLRDAKATAENLKDELDAKKQELNDLKRELEQAPVVSAQETRPSKPSPGANRL